MNLPNHLFFIGMLLLLLASADLYAKENNMIYSAQNIQADQKKIPPLDLDKPQNLETATFALG
jgi:CHASE3 domain sensor protein